ncbi:hypothetical protein LI253_16945, partial [Gordonibacter pamelaeae]|nr:hypothetical protein [Gordonibacter pamelaeae]
VLEHIDVVPGGFPPGYHQGRFLNGRELRAFAATCTALPFRSATALAKMPRAERNKPARSKGVKTVCHCGQIGIVIHGYTSLLQSPQGPHAH